MGLVTWGPDYESKPQQVEGHRLYNPDATGDRNKDVEVELEASRSGELGRLESQVKIGLDGEEQSRCLSL